MTSQSPTTYSSHPLLPANSRLILALRETPIIWASSLRYPAPALSLLARLPSSPPFLARIAPHSANSSAAVVTYRTHLQLAPSFLIIRSPSSSASSPAESIVGLLPLAAARISQARPGVLTFAGILLEPHLRDFAAVAAALSRAVARPPPPPLSRFEVLETLAVGPRAKVYAVRDRSTGERLALKLLRRPEEATRVAAWRTRLVHDRAILHRVRGHPFILDLRHATLLPDAAALFFEHCPHDLFNLIRLRGAPLSEQEAAAVVAQLLLAMSRVHAAGGAVTAGPGRGLRPENVLLDDHGWVRLASFGYCSVLDQGLLDDAHLFRKQALAAKKSRRRARRRENLEGHMGKQTSSVGKTEGGDERSGHGANLKHTQKDAEKDAEETREALTPKTQVGNDDPIGKAQESPQKAHKQDDAGIGTPSAGNNAKAARVNSALSADLWSLGALSHFVLTGEFPFQESSALDGSSTSSSDDDEHKKPSGQDVGMSPAIESEAARDFVGGLLQRDPAARLGCGVEGLISLQKHTWLGEILWQDLERRQGPYALRIQKHKDVDLLDLGEQNIRETFSSPVLPEGLYRRDSRRGRLSKLFSRDSREGRESDEKMKSPVDRSTEVEGNDRLLDFKDGKVENFGDEGFAFGFGFSSLRPAFSAAAVSRKKPAVEGNDAGSLEGGRRRRWSGHSKGERADVAAAAVR